MGRWCRELSTPRGTPTVGRQSQELGEASEPPEGAEPADRLLSDVWPP